MTEKPLPQIIAGRYRVVKKLGQGGMGSIYLAHDDMLERDVAIKMLDARQMDSAAAAERFLREARSVARLAHPNIMTLYDMGKEGEQHYLVLEYIQSF